MKKIILIVAALVILLVTAFVIFVMSIDWNEHKTKIAEQFSSLTGKRVVFDGAVELSFFPSPYLTVENVKIYNDKQSANIPLAQINRLVANLELIPFIKGEFNVKKMSLINPLVNVLMDENGKCNWDTELMPEQRMKMAETPVKLDSLSIEKATLTVKDSVKGIDWTFRNLSAEVTADSLLGPFRIEGSYIKDSNPAGFAFSIGRLDTNMSTSVNAVINNPASQTMLRFDGSVLPSQNVFSGNVVFESKKLMQFVTENFKNIKFDAKYDIPLAFSTQVNANSQKMELSNFVIKYGDTVGAGNIIIPVINSITEGREKDANKIEVAFDMTDLDLEPIVYFLTNELKQIKENGKFAINTSADIIADIKAVNVKYGTNKMRDAELSVDILPQKININTMKVTLSGDSKFELWGAIFAGKEGELRYQSEARLRSNTIIALLKTLGINPKVPVTSVYQNFNGVAKFDGSLSELKITPIEFILDKTKISGEAALVNENDKFRMLVVGDIDGINFDNYLSEMPDDIRSGTLNQKILYFFSQIDFLKDTDLQCKFNLGWGIYDNLPFENVTLDATLKDGIWDIAKLNIPNISGATVNVSGKVKGYGDVFEFENLKYNFESEDILAWLSKFSIKLPEWRLESFKKFVSDGVMNGTLSNMIINNTAKLENIEFSYNGEIKKDIDNWRYNGTLQAKSPDFLKMLNSFKIDYAPNVYSLGVFNFHSDLESKNDALEFRNLNVSIGQNLFQGYVSYANDGGIKKLSGNVTINQFEPERFFYNGTPQRTNNEAVSFKVEDTEKMNFLPKPLWSTTKINYNLYKNWNVNLDIDIGKLVYKNTILQNNKFNLLLANNLLKIDNIQSDYAKGNVSGNINLNFNALPLIDGEITLNKVNLDDRFWNGKKYGFNYGTITSMTKFSASAESVEDMIKSIDAESEFKLERLEFRGFNLMSIEEDLQKRTKAEGLSKVVQENLEKGETPFHMISGIMKIAKGDYVFQNMNFSNPMGYTLTMDAKGSLLLWDVNAKFSLAFRKVSLPPFLFDLSGSISNPELNIDITPIADFYQKRKDEMEAKLQAEEQERLHNLQTGMNEQMNITKAMENRVNDDLRVKLKQIQNVAKSEKAIADLTNVEVELNNIVKGISEVLTLGTVPLIEQKQIDEAQRRNGLLQTRIENAANVLQMTNVEDIKYRANEIYSNIANIHETSKNKLNEYKIYYNNLYKRLAKLDTDYSMENDAQISAYNAVIESLFVELDDINTLLSQEYIKMQNTMDTNILAESEAMIADKLIKAERNQIQLNENISMFYAYALPQVEREEQIYNEKLRKEEIARKVKENTGKISVAGVGGKSVTIVRDIEEIEKSETLQEQEKIPVLDFSKKKEENVIVNREARLSKTTKGNERIYLRQSQGKISEATGVIVRK